ncbi:hypothetical protein [Actinoplanes sp. NPDC026619]|uniref:hypothetical protein n=1 Tax=Actinoplanes sp. NPDC026619 TaxID=3155798 RepID=UPI00340ECEF5
MLDNLGRGLRAEQDAELSGRDANPEPFAHALLQDRPSLARALVGAVIDEPAGSLTRLLPVAVRELLLSDADAGWEAIETLLDCDDLELTRLTAAGLHRFRGGRAVIDARERAILERLLAYEDDVVRLQALQVVRQISEYDRPMATELLLTVSFDQSPAVAEHVFYAFGEHGYLPYEDLGDTDRERILAEIASLPTIDEYAVQAFLADLSATYSDEVLQLLKHRSAAEVRPRISGYRALPDRWHKELRFRGSPRFGELLWDAITWVAENLDGTGGLEPGAVFAAVAVTYDDAVLVVLGRALGAGTANYIRAVGEVLEYAHRTFVWDHSDFVTQALDAADEHRDQCSRAMRRGIYAAVRKDGFGGPIGAPARHHLEQRDRSRAVAAALTEGSAGREFYEALARSAESEILGELGHDRLFLESRDW